MQPKLADVVCSVTPAWYSQDKMHDMAEWTEICRCVEETIKREVEQ